MRHLAATDFNCQCPASHQQLQALPGAWRAQNASSDVTAVQLDHIESRQVEALPAADVSNQDDAAVLEEEIRELQHVVRCSP